MTHSDISTLVSSILSAFGTGRDLFIRLQGKKQLKRLQKEEKAKGDRRTRDNLQHRNRRRQKKSHCRDLGDESGVEDERMQEQLLRKSLEKAPEDIRREYDTSVQRLGERFKRGDELAHGSLAHTLLVLNAGLMRLISTCLLSDGGGPVSRTVSVAGRRSLLNLSESAAAEAINALDELRQRLVATSAGSLSLALPSSQRQPRRKAGPTSRASVASKDKPRRQGNQRAKESLDKPRTASSVASYRSSDTSNTSPKRAAYNPPSNGGAWVRSRKNSSVSVVTTVVSHRPKKPVHASQPEPERINSNTGHSSISRLPNGQIDFRQFSRPLLNPITSVPMAAIDERTNDPSLLPARSPLIPLVQNLQPPRPEPPSQISTTQTSNLVPMANFAQDSESTNHRFSILSFSSDSTKLGEIPPRKRPESYVPPQANLFPGPVVEAGYKAKPKSGLRFWKRFGRGRTSSVEVTEGATG